MRPVLLQIGNFTVRSWGVFVMLGIIVGVLLAMRESERKGTNPEHIIDLTILLILSGIIGARVMYVLTNWGEYRNNLSLAFSIRSGGLAWPGAFLFGLITTIFFVRWRRLLFWNIADILTPYIALGYSIARIGCFLNGCCFGKVIERTWYSVYMHGAYRYPTQIISSIASFIIFFFLVTRAWDDKPGKRFLTYIILYGIYRFLVEFLRYNSRYIVGLSITQWGMLGTILVTAIILYGKSINWKRRTA